MWCQPQSISSNRFRSVRPNQQTAARSEQVGSAVSGKAPAGTVEGMSAVSRRCSFAGARLPARQGRSTSSATAQRSPMSQRVALVRLAPTSFRPFAHVVSTQRFARSCVNAIGLGYKAECSHSSTAAPTRATTSRLGRLMIPKTMTTSS